MDAALGRYPVSVTIPVAWGEMDAYRSGRTIHVDEPLRAAILALEAAAARSPREDA